MRVSDAALDEVRDQGFTIVEGFLSGAELDAALAAIATEFPTHDDYFADPAAHEALVSWQFAGNRPYPYRNWELNRLAFHPELVDAAQRFCGTTDLLLYKVEAWAKYSGSVDYDQLPHRDFGNHNMLVPRADRRWAQLTSFLFLSDVTDADGPTAIVPRSHTNNLPLSTNRLSDNPYADVEVTATGPAGTLLLYSTDVVHRGTAMTGHPTSRFSLLADYMSREASWLGRRAWPDTGNDPAWQEILGHTSPRERELFGIPAPGHEYWNDQTITDVGVRYPLMDMTPYWDARID